MTHKHTEMIPEKKAVRRQVEVGEIQPQAKGHQQPLESEQAELGTEGSPRQMWEQNAREQSLILPYLFNSRESLDETLLLTGQVLTYEIEGWTEGTIFVWIISILLLS